jgi:hypothetical protein
MRVHTTIVAIVAMLSLGLASASAADAPASAPASAPADAPAAAPAEAPAAAPVGTPEASLAGADAACLEWTDGCRVCARSDGKKETRFACSNISIACQPTQGRCTKR